MSNLRKVTVLDRLNELSREYQTSMVDNDKGFFFSTLPRIFEAFSDFIYLIEPKITVDKERLISLKERLSAIQSEFDTERDKKEYWTKERDLLHSKKHMLELSRDLKMICGNYSNNILNEVIEVAERI